MHHGRSNAGRRRNTERGAILVEAVMILPILLGLTFGAIEFGLGFSRRAAVESVSRTGVRIAAANSGAADVGGRDGMSLAAVQAVNAALRTGTLPEMQELLVYQEDGVNGPGACGANCVRFAYNPVTEEFDEVPTGNPWLFAERHFCPPNADRVTVFIRSRNNFVTGLFGAHIDFESPATMQLEPQGSCATS